MLRPFQSRVYDSSGRTARMSDLMRAEAAARSNAELQAANASAQMWQGVGQTVANVAGDYAKAEREKPQRELREAQAADIKQGLDTKRQITEVLKLTRNSETGELDLRQAAKEISVIDPVQAQEFFSAADAQTKRTLLENKERLEQLGQLAGATLLNLDHMPPPQRAAAIRSVAQEAVSRGLVDAKDIPEQPTESWLRESFTRVLSTSDLADRLAAQEKPQEPGSLDGYLASLAQTKGGPLTGDEILKGRQEWETAGRAPATPKTHRVTVPGPNGQAIERLATEEELTRGVTAYRAPEKSPAPDRITQAQRAAAERWKQSELSTLERQFRESKDSLNPMTEAELEARKADIQVSYREQLGGRPATPPTSAAPPGPKVGDQVTVKGKTYIVGRVHPDGSWDPR